MTLAFGLKIKQIGLTWMGPYVRRESGAPIQNALIALAGPVASILTALAFSSVPEFARLNLICGVVNLVPLPHFDGANFLRAARAALRTA